MNVEKILEFPEEQKRNLRFGSYLNNNTTLFSCVLFIESSTCSKLPSQTTPCWYRNEDNEYKDHSIIAFEKEKQKIDSKNHIQLAIGKVCRAFMSFGG